MTGLSPNNIWDAPMANDVSKRTDAVPAPYGYREDGVPMTAIEASAKQIDDWAATHGFSGTVRMGIGPQHGDPEGWRGVKIGHDKALQQPPRQTIEREIELQRAISDTRDAEVVSMLSPPPPKLSWFMRLLNMIKGIR